jgi:transposase
MQIYYPHKNICKLYSLVVPEKSRTEHEKLCIESVNKWEKCHRSGMKPKEIQEVLGFSRATYHRRKKFLRNKTTRTSKFSKSTYDLILKIRKENPTYGKFKISVILKRDYNMQISESSVGRILKKLSIPK